MFRTLLVTLALTVTLLTGCHSTTSRRPACCPTGPAVVNAAPVPVAPVAPGCCTPTAPVGAIPAPVVPVPH